MGSGMSIDLCIPDRLHLFFYRITRVASIKKAPVKWAYISSGFKSPPFPVACYGVTEQREEFEKPWCLKTNSSSPEYPVRWRGDLLFSTQ